MQKQTNANNRSQHIDAWFHKISRPNEKKNLNIGEGSLALETMSLDYICNIERMGIRVKTNFFCLMPFLAQTFPRRKSDTKSFGTQPLLVTEVGRKRRSNALERWHQQLDYYKLFVQCSSQHWYLNNVCCDFVKVECVPVLQVMSSATLLSRDITRLRSYANFVVSTLLRWASTAGTLLLPVQRR